MHTGKDNDGPAIGSLTLHHEICDFNSCVCVCVSACMYATLHHECDVNFHEFCFGS
jgi:hypothetical protein